MAIYGIDLGTTNSLLGLGDKLLTGLVPSIVDIKSGKVGKDLLHDPNSVRSFKVDISSGIEGGESVLASSKVLMQLKKEADLKGKIKAVVTVPADFDDNQRRATIKAAELAQIEVVTLINEPTAAALYITKASKEVVVVFDLGGGTFDVSVIDGRFGNYDVQYSAGDPKCGGDNLDSNIVKVLCREGKISPFRLNPQQQLDLRILATNIKIRMQKERKDIVVDLTPYGGSMYTFKEAMYVQLMQVTFMKCITLMHRALASTTQAGEKFSMVLVGGSTRCPYLKEWIAKEIGQDPVECTYDPDKAVAYGAALYAQMYENNEVDYMVSDVTKAISIGMADGTAQIVIPPNSKIPIEDEIMLWNPVEAEVLSVEVYQGDSGIASKNSHIGTLRYEYGETMKPRMGTVLTTVRVQTSGVVKITCQQHCKPVVEKELIIT